MKHLYFALLSALPFLASAQISVTVVNDSASCQFPCNGYVEVAVTGGTPPYNFLMAPSAQTNTTGIFTNVCAGTYTITILDASFNTFTYTDSIGTISTPTITNVTTTPIQPPVNYGAQANIAGGTPPYIVTWFIMPAQTVIQVDTVNTLFDTIAGLTPGDYGVSVTDLVAQANGCTGLNPLPTTFSICDASVGSGAITVSPNDTVCSGVAITINYQPLLAGPVFPLFQLYTSDNVMCNPAVSNGTYTCNITQTTTFNGQWFYTTGCPPVNYVPLTVVVDPCSGIEEQAANNMNVFPNPTTGNFRVISGLTGLLTVELYDYTGKLAYSTTAYDGAEILAPLTAGIYALRVTDGQTSLTTKLTITE